MDNHRRLRRRKIDGGLAHSGCCQSDYMDAAVVGNELNELKEEQRMALTGFPVEDINFLYSQLALSF